MLSEALKDRIRDAYSATVAARNLSPRRGQRQMIGAVARALARLPGDGSAPSEPPICVVEAGTGTGKTLAYALAAIPIAQDRGKRLVVATATVALQEQFVHKDLPDIAAGSGLAFTAALAKGRRRYVCLSKLDRQLAQGQDASAAIPLYPDELPAAGAGDALPVYESMIDALGRGSCGVRDSNRQRGADIGPRVGARAVLLHEGRALGARSSPSPDHQGQPGGRQHGSVALGARRHRQPPPVDPALRHTA